MTIQDYASIGEIVGAIATVITLAYLAVQIRQSTRATRAQSALNSQARNDIYATSIAENPQLADVFQRGLMDFGSLTDGERMQFTFLFSIIVGVVEGVFGEVRNGVSDPALLDRSVAGISTLLKTPGGREYWNTYSIIGGYTNEFRAFMEKHL